MGQEPIAHRRKSDGAQQSVDQHLENVSDLAAAFADKIGASRLGKSLGLLHDLGKYSEAFQKYIGSAVGLINDDEDDYVDAKALRGKIDHSSAGAQLAYKILTKEDASTPKKAEVARLLALCAASHHSGLIDCLDADGNDVFSQRINKNTKKTHLKEITEPYNNAKDTINKAKMLLESDEVVEEWWKIVESIGSKNKEMLYNAPRNALLQTGLAVRFLFSCLLDADRTDTARFTQEKGIARDDCRQRAYVPWDVLAARLENKLASMPSRQSIDQWRRDIAQCCLGAATRPTGIYTLTVPTGGGKTLASLRFAFGHAKQHGLERVITVIPFTSIIDQSARTAREVLEPDDAPEDKGKIVLEHHSNITPEQETKHEKVLCQNWDAPVVYTTMVQFLEALFGAGTRGARRMHRLANAVLIFDEVQTLPVKCTHLFNNALNFLAEQCGSTVLLCTATQPLLHAVDCEKGAVRLAKDHEITSDAHGLSVPMKRVEVHDKRKPECWSIEEVAQLARDEKKRTGSCLVVVNTDDKCHPLSSHMLS